MKRQGPRNRSNEMAKIFAARFDPYCESTGLSAANIGKIIGKSKQTVGYYRQGESSPVLKDLPRLAASLGLSAGYLLGESAVHKWSHEIGMARLYLRGQLKRVQLSDTLSHMSQIIAILGERSDLCQEPWLLAAAMGAPITYVKALMAEPEKLNDIDEVTLERFAEFIGLSTAWLHQLKDEDLPDPSDLEEYYPALAKFVRHGITGEELSRHAEALIEMAYRNRRQVANNKQKPQS